MSRSEVTSCGNVSYLCRGARYTQWTGLPMAAIFKEIHGFLFVF